MRLGGFRRFTGDARFHSHDGLSPGDILGQIEETTAMPYTEYERYACVPSATALILTYLGREPNCPDFFEEFRVDADGLTPASDIIRICERYGLHCNAYRGLSIRQIKNYLSEGFAVILITYNTSRQHAVSLFEAKGDILAADLLQPLHLANMDVLKKTLSHGAVSIVIGENPVPSLNSITQYWYLLILAAVVCVSIFLYFFYNKRRIKNET